MPLCVVIIGKAGMPAANLSPQYKILMVVIIC